MPKPGRPKQVIDLVQLEKLCNIHATMGEICHWFQVSPDTIERTVKKNYRTNFAEYYADHSAKGVVSLRRKQWELALNGDRVMLIWLGKQYLEQTDRKQIELDMPSINVAPQVQVVLTLPDNGRVVLPEPEGRLGIPIPSRSDNLPKKKKADVSG